MNSIPVAKPMMGLSELDAVNRVLSSGVLANGPESRAFEAEWAAYLGADEAALVSNGTTALEGALLSLAHGKDRDEVLVPAMSFNATSSAVLAAGLRPVFVDIQRYSNNINHEQVEALINRRTLGIIAVDLYGLMADYEALNSFGLPIIEDAAQAHGSEYKGMRPGSRALYEKYPNLYATTFSFYATKNLTTGGEGGAVVAPGAVMNDIRLLREHGQTERYHHASAGHNWRVTELQAAIGREQLRKLPAWQDVRYANAQVLNKGLHLYFDKPYYNDMEYTHGWHQYVTRVVPEFRDPIMHYMKEHGVGTGVHYPVADPRQPMYGYKEFAYPNAEHLAKEAISLPIGPWVGHEELATIIEVANNGLEWAEKNWETFKK